MNKLTRGLKPLKEDFVLEEDDALGTPSPLLTQVCEFWERLESRTGPLMPGDPLGDLERLIWDYRQICTEDQWCGTRGPLLGFRSLWDLPGTNGRINNSRKSERDLTGTPEVDEAHTVRRQTLRGCDSTSLPSGGSNACGKPT